MTKLVCLAMWGARLALVVVVDDGLWQSSMAGVVNDNWLKLLFILQRSLSTTTANDNWLPALSTSTIEK